MDLLIASNSVPLADADTVPTSGTPQWATDGNPVTGVPATGWPSYHYNMVMGELYNLVVAAGITPSGTDNTQVLQSIKKLVSDFVPAGLLLLRTKFTASGTFTPQSSATRFRVIACGGGGSGGACPACSSTQQATAGGGSCGAFAIADFSISVTGSGPFSVTIGAGGTSPAAGSNSGNGGGATSLGGLITIPGGTGGTAGLPSSAATTVFAAANDSTLPTIANGTFIVCKPGLRNGQPQIALGINAGNVRGGDGGTCDLGAGGSGGFGAHGVNATGYGGGGGGCSQNATDAGDVGGAGYQGAMIIEEYS